MNILKNDFLTWDPEGRPERAKISDILKWMVKKSSKLLDFGQLLFHKPCSKIETGQIIQGFGIFV